MNFDTEPLTESQVSRLSTKSSFNPSPYQQAVFDHVESKKSDSTIVEAVAGSGKTTTLMELVELLPRNRRIQILAFNKEIQLDFQNRLDSRNLYHAKCQTTHGFGNAALMRHSRRPIDGNKTIAVIKDLSQKNGWNFGSIMYLSKTVQKLVSLFKLMGYHPEPGKGLKVLTAESFLPVLRTGAVLIPNILKIAEDRREPQYQKVAELAFRTFQHGLDFRIYDFDDMLYLPFIHKLKLAPCDMLFVDEAQDLSNLQHHLLSQAFNGKPQIVAVGDRRQALYGWRGAHATSMDVLKAQYQMTELPLSICYRCPKSVVEEAKKLVPQIQAFDEAEDGEVRYRHLDEMNLSELISTAVLCRKNAPLIRLSVQLLSENIRFGFLGQDMAKLLTGWIEEVGPDESQDSMDFIVQYEAHLNQQILASENYGDFQRASELQDRITTIRLFCKPKFAVHQVIEFINRFFGTIANDQPNMVTLSTVHKSKGKEFPVVHYLQTKPSAFTQSADQEQEELNIRYVAITRAQKKLVYLESSLED